MRAIIRMLFIACCIFLPSLALHLPKNEVKKLDSLWWRLDVILSSHWPVIYWWNSNKWINEMKGKNWTQTCHCFFKELFIGRNLGIKKKKYFFPTKINTVLRELNIFTVSCVNFHICIRLSCSYINLHILIDVFWAAVTYKKHGLYLAYATQSYSISFFRHI